MRRIILIFIGIFLGLFTKPDRGIFYIKNVMYSHNSLIKNTHIYNKSNLNVYKWIDPKDEKSLIDKMGFQKVSIASSKEVIPTTNIKLLNFSNKSNVELHINDEEKKPLHYFSETYTTPPFYFYTINDALVFLGENTRKFLVFKNGFYTFLGRQNDYLEKILLKLLEKENIFYDKESGDIYLSKDLDTLHEVKNKTIFFHGDWNLYHLIMEPSPALLLMNEIMLTNDTDYTVNLAYFSEQNTSIVKELGPPHILSTQLYSFKKFSDLIIPSPILENNAHFPNIELMNRLIKRLKRSFSKKTQIKPLGKKIYVSRSDASRRKVLNEVELIKHLKKRGFKIVTPGQYTLPEQSKLFEKAEIIIGPHGMGLINMLFSNNLNTVIELFGINWHLNCYLRTAQIKRAKHYYGLFHNPEGPHVTWLSDFNANIPEILKILDTLER